MPPVGFALIAGGLSTINPCGFALMPAFLSLYVGANEDDLPAARTRLLQGLVVGLVVSAGFFTVFTVAGLPIIWGATRITQAVPWAGLAVGVLLVLAALAILAGRHLSVSLRAPIASSSGGGIRRMFVFGVGYGTASLGCTLPVFLAVVGASLATRGFGSTLAVFVAYGVGMSVVVTALALAAALMRTGLQRKLKKLIPNVHRVSGALLLVTGGYLTYYWARVLFGSPTSLGDDPLVGPVERFVASIQRLSSSAGGVTFVAVALGVVAVAVVIAVWQATGSRPEDAGGVPADADPPARAPSESRGTV